MCRGRKKIEKGTEIMRGSDGSGKQSSVKKSGNNDDDPFVGMTSDDDGGGQA